MSSRAKKKQITRAQAGAPSGGYEPRDVCWCGSQRSIDDCAGHHMAPDAAPKDEMPESPKESP